MLIDGIKIVKQKQNNTCGYATAGMILNYFQGSNSFIIFYLLFEKPVLRLFCQR